MQSNKLLCAWHSAIYQVTFRWLFLTFSDVLAHLHMKLGLTYIAGAHPHFWAHKQAGAHPHFGAHKQAGAQPH